MKSFFYQRTVVKLLIATSVLLLNSLCVRNAHATLSDWQNEVAIGTLANFSEINVNTPLNPVSRDIGLYDQTTGGGITYEFIVNGVDTGASSALLGTATQDGRDRGGIKFEQWQDTLTYGVTEFGVADYDSGVALSTNTDVHLAFVNNGMDYQLYVDGALSGTMAGASFEIEGLVGIGGIHNDDDSFGDIFDGTVIGVAVYDSALSATEINTHSEALFSGTFMVTANRDTGELVLNNQTTTPIDILGYSIRSSSGSLSQTSWTTIKDNYDSSGDGSVDNDDIWTVLSNSNSHTDLSEAQIERGPGAEDGGSIAASSSVSLGSIWVKNPSEDLVIELLRSNGTLDIMPVSFIGNNDAPFAFGDLNFQDGVTAADWDIYIANAGADLSALSPAEAYQQGDLNGDGINNLTDTDLFIEAYDAANGLGAFAAMITSVPEPSNLALLLLGVMFCFVGTVRRAHCKKELAVSKALTIALSAILLPNLLSTQNAQAALLDWQGEVASGATAAFTEINVNTPLNPVTRDIGLYDSTTNGGITYEFIVNGFDTGASSALLGTGTQDGRDRGGIKFEQWPDTLTYGVTEFGVADYDSGVAISTDEDVHLAFVNNGTDYQLYVDGALSGTMAGANFEIEGLVGIGGIHNDDDTFGDVFDGTVIGVAVYDSALSAGEIGLHRNSYFENSVLELEVNKTTGLMTMSNPTSAPIAINGYEITSAAGALSTTGWNSFSDQNLDPVGDGLGSGESWDEAGAASANLLLEGFLLGSTSFDVAASHTLGAGFDTSVLGSAVDGDLEFSYRLTDGSVKVGAVSYVTGGTLEGDFDGSNSVGNSDLTLLLDNWGATVPPTPAGWTNDLPTAPGVGNDDLTRLLDNWGNSIGGLSTISAVPEPSTAMLAVFGLVGGLWLTGRKHPKPKGSDPSDSARNLLTGMSAALVALTMIGNPAQAAMDDLSYLLGDDVEEIDAGAAVGVTVGSLNLFGSTGITLDSVGPTGAFIDLNVSGNPKYVGGALSSSTLGVSFDGSGDRLSTGISVNSPNDFWDSDSTTEADDDDIDYFSPNNNYPFNYSGIFSRGMQVWAKPNSGTTGQVQTIVADSNQHSIVITAGDTWAMLFDEPDQVLDSGIAVNSTGQNTGANADEVSANGYTHLMALSGAYIGIAGEPDMFNAQGQGTALGALFYVNGVATIGTDDFFYDPSDAKFSIGADENDSNFYHGDLDDLRLFVWGDNSSTTQTNSANAVGQDYGTLDLANTNEWIATELAERGITNDGDVDLDGDIDNDDVTEFVNDWLKVRLVAEVGGGQVIAGDWISRRDNSDLNYDGVTNLLDAFILHEALASTPLGGLDFSLLESATVPEPSCLVLLISVTVGYMGMRRKTAQ